MPYVKGTWTDEVLAGDERYNILTDAGAPIESNVQIALDTSITIPGTAVTAARMNNIETGVEAASIGWFPVTGTWTRASATTITVPAGAALLYQVGDYLRLKQGGAFKYWVIYSVADTLITVIANSDYTLDAAAITEPGISRAANPLGWPGVFNFATTPTGFSSVPTNSVYQYRTMGRSIIVQIRQATAGTSNATTFTIPSPCPARVLLNGAWSGTMTYQDNGVIATTFGRLLISTAGTEILAYTNALTGAWIDINGKRIITGQIEYQF